MLITRLALRDLWRDRFFFACNLAVMIGVLVPLLVLFGVKNGVYQALVGQLLSNPAMLQIDSQGNAALTDADLAPLHDWPEVSFLVPRTRSQFDYVNLQAKSGGRILRQALLLPTGPGDPNLPQGMVLAEDEVAISNLLAQQMKVAPGDDIVLVTQAEQRPRQLMLPMRIRLILPESAIAGRSVLAPYRTLDLVEAFYDSYALPDYGITQGRPLSERVSRYEGVRLYARDLGQLGALQARVETTLGIATNARTREVNAVLGLGRNLNIALALITVLAALGLTAALIFAFFSDIARKRPALAALAILGIPATSLALLPLIQAAITALAGLTLSFAIYALATLVAVRLFGAGLPPGSSVASISSVQGALIALAVLALVLAAAAAAAWSTLRTDPALVLREGK